MAPSGHVTRDGCPVDVYAELPTLGEPEWIHSLAPMGGSILDLGSGVGRLADPLADLGHRVVAVDDSSEMLARVARAETVLSRIESLRLPDRFDVVLLASHLLNTPDDAQRAEMLEAVRRHLAPQGIALIELHPPEWFDRISLGRQLPGRLGAVTATLNVTSFDGHLLLANVDYELRGDLWSQSFTARRLSGSEIKRAFNDAGLRQVPATPERLDWVAARAK